MKKKKFDIDKLSNRIKAENAAYDAAMKTRLKEARKEGERIAAKIWAEVPGVKRILGFGSVFEEGRSFSEISDIDLAIEGGDYFKAFKMAEDSVFRVDLVDLTGRESAFLKLIKDRGIVLFELIEDEDL